VRFFLLAALVATTALAQQPAQPPSTSLRDSAAPRIYLGFDRNDYPGDAALTELHKHFAFTGYWLNNPPGATRNTWLGKREALVRAGFGFLIVANGRLDAELIRAAHRGKSAAAFGRADAADAVAAAHREGFPAGAILFLDQEEGGRLLPEQGAYLYAWTETVARSAYLPGVYASGHPSNDGPGPNGKPIFITTIQDIREQVAAKHLHPIAFWVAEDACPPAPGCLVSPDPPAPDASGTLDSTAWQFAQSPRRPSLTRACGRTYVANGNCNTPAPARFDVDLSSALSPDPSHGR
jgi:hypothetical protein